MRPFVFVISLILLGVFGAIAFAVFVALDGSRSRDVRVSGTVGDSGQSQSDISAVTVIAEGLEIPWDIAFLPDGALLVTERPGRVVKIMPDGTRTEVPYDADVQHRGEGGLLGLVMHPDFAQNHLVYLYHTTAVHDRGTINRVVRYIFENDMFSSPQVIVDDIPGAAAHDGGRMEFGPDGYLYITTGDATREAIAQDAASLGGKILRITDEGETAPGNPFGTAVYSYGHRNPQGLTWDERGKLWETEHGRSGMTSGMDEINSIRAGGNYGWPEIEGDETRNGMIPPVLHSGAQDTWAPASLAYHEGSLFFGGLRGEALYEVPIKGEQLGALQEHFKGTYGRIRTVRVGPDGFLYITTSNRDGRGTVHTGDDKIIRIDPRQL